MKKGKFLFKKLLNKSLTKNLILKKKITTISKKIDYSYLIYMDDLSSNLN